ncbi:hypothetical protein [Clostridium sp. JN-9]|uniref:hypothetical protein n=1 Tax=Clostridium sp. JN-9 TaxID=2507159 RepID=UPI000FFE10E5|nr:hypothetical protein [Clostridium sp. JN-9]QAT40275.1 hypothetical protein EQM05_08390 [Clostridium sp. JN-9]
MDNDAIIEILEDNGIDDIEIIDTRDNIIVLRFFYDFDEDEIKAAKAYANDMSKDKNNVKSYTENFIIPYLSDIAVDNVGDIIEDIMEDLHIEAQFISYDIDNEDYTYNEFTAVFYEKNIKIDFDKILEELNL